MGTPRWLRRDPAARWLAAVERARVGRPERSRGAAAIELAFVLPILCALLFGVISYGYMLSFRQAISQAGAEGARAAAVVPAGTTAGTRTSRAQSAVNSGLGSYGVSCNAGQLQRKGVAVGTCAISSPGSCTSPGATATAQCVSVRLDYRYRDHTLMPAFPGLGLVLPASLSFASEVEVTS